METTRCRHCHARLPPGSRFCSRCGRKFPVASSRGMWGWLAGGLAAAVLAAGTGALVASVSSGEPLAPAGGPAAAGGRTAAADAAGGPEWLRRAPPRVRVLYQWAAANRETLQYIPCFCGCGSVGHQSNYECYYRPNPAGGPPDYDAHAFG